MRVLFVTAYVPSLIRIRPYSLIRQLVREGVSVEVAALASGISDERAAENLRADGIPVRTVGLTPFRGALNCLRALPTPTPLQAAYCFSREMNGVLAEMVGSGRFDLVHVEHLRAAHFGLSLTSLPVVYDAVDSLTLLQRRTLQHGTLKARTIAALELSRTRRYEAAIANHFARVLVSSPVDRDELLALNRLLPVAVVPNGMDIEYFDNSDGRFGKAQEDTIVLTGKMSYHANVAAAMYLVHEVMPLVWRERPAARVCIVGTSPPRSVRKLASDRVIITGEVPDVRPYLANAAVATCPVQVKAGIQNKIIEAMAMGVPVVSSELGVEGLYVRPGEDVLVGRTREEQAKHILDLLASPGRRAELAGRGREYVEKYHDLRAVGRKLLEIYEDVL